MKVIFQTVFIVLILSSTFVYAEEEYQMQISLSESHFERGTGLETDTHIVTASHYFSPVNTTGHPFAEAAFFERIGQVSVHAGPSEIKAGTSGADEFSYGVFARLAKPRDPLTAQISYSTTDREFNFPIIGNLIIERYGLHLGYFLLDNFHLNFAHGRSKTKRSIVGFSNLPSKNQSYAINMKWVEKLPKKRAFNLQGGFTLNRFDDPTEDGKNWIVSLSGDYYLNRRVSIGGGAVINRGDKEFREGEGYSADILAFLNPNFSFALLYFDFSGRNSGRDDETLYRVSLSTRF